MQATTTTAAASTETTAEINISPAPDSKSNQAFIPLDSTVAESVKDFYGLVPSTPVNQFFSRTESAKNIVFVCKNLCSFLSSDTSKAYRIIQSGLLVLEKNCKTKTREVNSHRVSQEGVHALAPFMTSRLVHMGVDDFCIVIKHSLLNKGYHIDARQFSEPLQRVSSSRKLYSCLLRKVARTIF